MSRHRLHRDWGDRLQDATDWALTILAGLVLLALTAGVVVWLAVLIGGA